MIRGLVAISFAFLVFGFALFLWQKQVARYQFSLEKEKALFSGVGDVVKDFEAALEPLDEFMRNLEALQRFATTTATTATTTSATTTPEGL
jgi:hypothetical protein